MKSVLLFTAAALVVSCGHPATQKECEEIAERVALLELKQSPAGNDPATIKEEVEKTQAWVRSSSIKDCVGKRITDAAMRCVREAKTSQEIVDGCFK